MDVLVIDDNELMQHVLCRFITMTGHTAASSASLAEAQARATAQRFDMMLVDMRLPDADGPEALARLRQIPGYDNVIAVAISGDSQPPEREIERAGFSEYLAKPIEFTGLQACIERAVQLLSREHGS